jgi:hypothetical protein
MIICSKISSKTSPCELQCLSSSTMSSWELQLFLTLSDNFWNLLNLSLNGSLEMFWMIKRSPLSSIPLSWSDLRLEPTPSLSLHISVLKSTPWYHKVEGLRKLLSRLTFRETRSSASQSDLYLVRVPHSDQTWCCSFWRLDGPRASDQAILLVSLHQKRNCSSSPTQPHPRVLLPGSLTFPSLSCWPSFLSTWPVPPPSSGRSSLS